jgi:alpha-galactosidase
VRRHACGVAKLLPLTALLVSRGVSRAADPQVVLKSPFLAVSIRPKDGAYVIESQGLRDPVFIAGVGASIDQHRVVSADYPRRKFEKSSFQDALGRGDRLQVTYTGLANQPDLICTLELYELLPYGTIEVVLKNSTARQVTVQSIRSVDAIGKPKVNLGADSAADRILSDTFSDYDFKLRIARDLAQPAGGIHRGVGSQLIYNRQDGESLFVGALAARRFLTVLQIKGERSSSGSSRISLYTVDSTGTTEFQEASILHGAPEPDRIKLSLPVPPGAELAAEPIMFAVGHDCHAQLEAYGKAIRVLHHARVNGPNLMGWWSWTAYYGGISESTALTNAHWLSEQLKNLGFNWFHIDEGYAYARGEYATTDAHRFPSGMRQFGRDLCELGLKFAIWTAPFEVSERSWIYRHHRDWLVRNRQGSPIAIGDAVLKPGDEHLYVLDTTNPGAQSYLREEYRTLTREWGVRYIKLDFMDHADIEGYRYRPGTTALEAQRIGLEVIRQAVGDGVLLDKDGSPMLSPVGYVDEGRISCDTGHSFDASKDSAPGIASRYYMNRNFYVSDPDAFTVTSQLIPDEIFHQSKEGLTLREAEVSIVLAALSGGMFEIGDDLPMLTVQPERLALIKNADLLDMVKLKRAATPLDLMTFDLRDEQPSVFWLRENRRQGMLAIFNWTGQPRSHKIVFDDLGLGSAGQIEAYDALDHGRPIELTNRAVQLLDQAPHSVRLLKLVDASLPKEPPVFTVMVPKEERTGVPEVLATKAPDSESPVLGYRWTFGDGTEDVGAKVEHAYTQPGMYTLRVTAQGVDGAESEQTFSIKVKGVIKTTYEFRKNRRYQEAP